MLIDFLKHTPESEGESWRMTLCAKETARKVIPQFWAEGDHYVWAIEHVLLWMTTVLWTLTLSLESGHYRKRNRDSTDAPPRDLQKIAQWEAVALVSKFC